MLYRQFIYLLLFFQDPTHRPFWGFQCIYPIQQINHKEFYVSRTKTLQKALSLLCSPQPVLYMVNTSYITTRDCRMSHIPKSILHLPKTIYARLKCMVSALFCCFLQGFFFCYNIHVLNMIKSPKQSLDTFCVCTFLTCFLLNP